MPARRHVIPVQFSAAVLILAIAPFVAPGQGILSGPTLDLKEVQPDQISPYPMADAVGQALKRMERMTDPAERRALSDLMEEKLEAYLERPDLTAGNRARMLQALSQAQWLSSQPAKTAATLLRSAGEQPDAKMAETAVRQAFLIARDQYRSQPDNPQVDQIYRSAMQRLSDRWGETAFTRSIVRYSYGLYLFDRGYDQAAYDQFARMPEFHTAYPESLYYRAVIRYQRWRLSMRPDEWITPAIEEILAAKARLIIDLAQARGDRLNELDRHAGDLDRMQAELESRKSGKPLVFPDGFLVRYRTHTDLILAAKAALAADSARTGNLKLFNEQISRTATEHAGEFGAYLNILNAALLAARRHSGLQTDERRSLSQARLRLAELRLDDPFSIEVPDSRPARLINLCQTRIDAGHLDEARQTLASIKGEIGPRADLLETALLLAENKPSQAATACARYLTATTPGPNSSDPEIWLAREMLIRSLHSYRTQLEQENNPEKARTAGELLQKSLEQFLADPAPDAWRQPIEELGRQAH